MLILKIKDKGLYIEIPGTLPTRTPADIDITKCDLATVTMHLRKQGIKDYQIISESKKQVILKPPDMSDASINQKIINKRFSRLEKIMMQLLEKDKGSNESKEEQITKKLDRLEQITSKILEKDDVVVERVVERSRAVKKKSKEPKIEELDSTFIPNIDISSMKMKGGSKKTIKQDNVDLDDSADLLSRIMGQED
jgi:small-conductance mechanosensitive channel